MPDMRRSISVDEEKGVFRLTPERNNPHDKKLNTLCVSCTEDTHNGVCLKKTTANILFKLIKHSIRWVFGIF